MLPLLLGGRKNSNPPDCLGQGKTSGGSVEIIASRKWLSLWFLHVVVVVVAVVVLLSCSQGNGSGASTFVAGQFGGRFERRHEMNFRLLATLDVRLVCSHSLSGFAAHNHLRRADRERDERTDRQWRDPKQFKRCKLCGASDNHHKLPLGL